MKIKFIKELVSMQPDLQLYKRGTNDFLLLDSSSKSEIYRGARIMNFRFSTNISVWLSPNICFPSSDTIVFSNYQLVTEDGHQELTFSKDISDESQIFHKVKEVLENNLPPLRCINSLSLLEDYLLSEKEEWLVSAFSKAQYGLLCYYNQRNSSALDLIKSVYTSLNSHNPLTKDVEKFLSLTEQNDSDLINNYFKTICSLSESRVNNILC